MIIRKRFRAQALLVCALAVCMAAAVLATLSMEGYIRENPTPQEIAPVDENGETILPDQAVGSTAEEPVAFSPQSGLFSGAQKLHLSAEGALRIVYTLDGSVPVQDSEEVPEGGIEIVQREGEAISAYAVTARAVYEDGTLSDPVTRSYFVGSEIAGRFDCLVFSLTVDPHELYNYDDGIMIEGKMRDDWLAANPGVTDIQPRYPANYNQRGRASERIAYVEAYEYDGECILSQPCGVRVVGGQSRAGRQKALRIYARSEYDQEDNRFRYTFFPEMRDLQENMLPSQKKLTLRHGGDMFSLYMREAMISDLTHRTGVLAKYARPAALYLNGEYYGFIWCQSVQSEDMLEHVSTLDGSCWDLLEVLSLGYSYQDYENHADQSVADSWAEICSYAYRDLSDDAVLEELGAMIDLDDMLTYFALNMYADNDDWLTNNMKIYRYSTARSPEVDLSQYPQSVQRFADGRWRFLSFDMDLSMGGGAEVDNENILNMLDEKKFGLYTDYSDPDGSYRFRCDLLTALVRRPDLRGQFVHTMCDMMNWYFSTERIHTYMEMYSTIMAHELIAAHEQTGIAIEQFVWEYPRMYEWAEQRPAHVIRQLQVLWPEIGAPYTLHAAAVPEAEIRINTASVLPGDRDFIGRYFDGLKLPVSCTVQEGYAFDHWEINGERIEEQSFLLDPEAYDGDSLTLTLHLKDAGAGLRITEVCYKGGDGDYFVITNTGTQPLSTWGMQAWDGDEARRYAVPSLHIQPGESVRFVCRNYLQADALGSMRCSFSLREGETLSLYDAQGNTVDAVYLREGTSGGALALNGVTGMYEEFLVSQKSRILPADELYLLQKQ